MNIAKRSVTPNLAGTYAHMSHDTLTRLGMRTAALDGVALRRRFPFLTPTSRGSTSTAASLTCPR